ncbi:M15 family metallopeptidase [Haloimpatiens massiliensis]|uniref:M15 family metallopeptidase n=1 Tax=Haloimpatiens massiliensis TaxID=1658110 RepID=UPI000C85607E|nr:M15 family metallopeptidase [Haloimpatiens massiliensis]
MKKLLCSLILVLAIICSINAFTDLKDKENNLNNENTSTVVKETNPNITTKVNSTQTNKKTNILLINDKNKLSKSYIPKNLVIPKVKFISYADPNVKKMDIDAAVALESLFLSASKDNIELLAVSGYRTYEYQDKLYKKSKNTTRASDKATSEYVAKPGTSEHQSGLAMDVLSDECFYLNDSFSQTNAYAWLKENCYKYGFIIRYPKGRENITGYCFEPWHIRYIGLPASKEIMESDITLEEYLLPTGN